MIDELLNKIVDRIKGAFLSIVNFDWVPELVIWYWWLFLLFVAVSLVIYLFGWSRTVRMIASFLFLVGAIFVAGGHVMSRRLEKRSQGKAEDEQEREPDKPDAQWPHWW